MGKRFIFSEEERRRLIALIVHLHDDLRMGFRRISGELVARGYPEMGKDTIRKFYLEGTNQKISIQIIENEELRPLRQEEKEAERKAREAMEIQRIRERIIEHKVDEIMYSFDKRRELFTRQEKTLEFAEEVMQVVDPMLWTSFKECCEINGYDLANATAVALGEQKDYEERGDCRLDSYLKEQIKQSLNAWEKEEEENEAPTDSALADRSGDESEDKRSFVPPPTHVHETYKSWVEIYLPADINEPSEEWTIVPLPPVNYEIITLPGDNDETE